MKKGIHPAYKDATIVCACGFTVHTRATKPAIHVEICSSCHPFYTGKQKLVDSAGMVDKFTKRYAGKTVKAPKKEDQAVQKDKPAPGADSQVK